MNRSDLPTFAGYFYLFSMLSALAGFYWLYAVPSMRAISIYPGSAVPADCQALAPNR